MSLQETISTEINTDSLSQFDNTNIRPFHLWREEYQISRLWKKWQAQSLCLRREKKKEDGASWEASVPKNSGEILTLLIEQQKQEESRAVSGASRNLA